MIFSNVDDSISMLYNSIYYLIAIYIMYINILIIFVANENCQFISKYVYVYIYIYIYTRIYYFISFKETSYYDMTYELY